VSLAEAAQRERGLVRRGQADEWILAHEPPVPPVADPADATDGASP